MDKHDTMPCGLASHTHAHAHARTHTHTHLAYPQRPSLRYSLGRPSLMVLAQPGCVWMRTFKASQGARAMSAKNSALADAAKYREVRHK